METHLSFKDIPSFEELWAIITRLVDPKPKDGIEELIKVTREKMLAKRAGETGLLLLNLKRRKNFVLLTLAWAKLSRVYLRVSVYKLVDDEIIPRTRWAILDALPVPSPRTLVLDDRLLWDRFRHKVKLAVRRKLKKAGIPFTGCGFEPKDLEELRSLAWAPGIVLFQRYYGLMVGSKLGWIYFTPSDFPRLASKVFRCGRERAVARFFKILGIKLPKNPTAEDIEAALLMAVLSGKIPRPKWE